MMKRVTAVVVLILLVISGSAATPDGTKCSEDTFNFLQTALGAELHGLKKAVRDAGELVREASWAERHNASITAEEKARKLKAAEKVENAAVEALKKFEAQNLVGAKKAVSISCHLSIDNEARDPSPLHVLWQMQHTAIGAAYYWAGRYEKMVHNFQSYCDEQVLFIQNFMASRGITDDSDDFLWRFLYSLSLLMGPTFILTSIMMIVLFALPLLVVFHVVHDYLYQLWLLGLLKDLVPQYGMKFGLTSSKEVLLHFLNNNPHHVAVFGLVVAFVCILGSLFSLPWTMPILSLVTERPQKIRKA